MSNDGSEMLDDEMNLGYGMPVSDNTGISNLCEMPSVEKPGLGDFKAVNFDMGGEWTIWKEVKGTCISAPAVASWGENRLDIFAIGLDSGLYHKWWDNDQWNGWECLA